MKIKKMFSIAEMMYIEILEQELENEFGSTNNDLNDNKNLPQEFQFDDSETDTKDSFISDINPRIMKQCVLKKSFNYVLI